MRFAVQGKARGGRVDGRFKVMADDRPEDQFLVANVGDSVSTAEGYDKCSKEWLFNINF